MGTVILTALASAALTALGLFAVLAPAALRNAALWARTKLPLASIVPERWFFTSWYLGYVRVFGGVVLFMGAALFAILLLQIRALSRGERPF